MNYSTIRTGIKVDEISLLAGEELRLSFLETPVTCLSWSPVAAELVYSVEQNVYWRTLQADDKKARTWKAHSATVTTVALSLQGIIVSGKIDYLQQCDATHPQITGRNQRMLNCNKDV